MLFYCSGESSSSGAIDNAAIRKLGEARERVVAQLGQVIVGQQHVIEELLISDYILVMEAYALGLQNDARINDILAQKMRRKPSRFPRPRIPRRNSTRSLRQSPPIARNF